MNVPDKAYELAKAIKESLEAAPIRAEAKNDGGRNAPTRRDGENGEAVRGYFTEPIYAKVV
jgi:hypothetical protein